MDLKAVRIQNFLSVENATVDYSGSGVTLVVGPNGSGKSALFVEPLLWLFYDSLNRTTVQRYSGEVRRRYQNTPVDGEVSVEAWFSQDGHSIYAKRSLKDGYAISVDGGNITPHRSKGDGLLALQGLVRLPESLFKSIVVMGQGFNSRFSKFGDSDRTEVIEGFIGAKIFEDAQDYTAAQSATVEKSVAASRAAHLQASASLAETRRLLAESQANLAAALAGINTSRQALSDEAFQLGVRRSTADANRQQVWPQISAADVAIKNLEADERSIVARVGDVRGTIGGFDAVIAVHQAAVNRLRGLSGVCPTCNGVVNPQVVAVEISGLTLKANSVDLQRAEAEQQMRGLEQQLADVRASIVSWRQNLAGLNQQSIQADQEIREADHRYEAIQQELTRLGDQELSYEVYVRSLTERAEREQVELERLTEVMRQYETIAPYLGWWAEHFSVRGLRSWRLGGVLDVMNLHLAGYCQKFFDGEIMARLLPIKPQKTAKAKSVVSLEISGNAGSYELLSGGQQRCADLALHFALRRLAKDSAAGWSSNFLVGDEVFDHLDRRTAERAIEVIRGEAEMVFVATHSPALQAYCDSVMHVSKGDWRTVVG